MFKRIITLALAIVCLASVAIVGVNALAPEAEGEWVYTATLTTPASIEDVQGYITYDSSVLELVACETPNLGDSAIVNTEETGVVYFNASVVKGLDFTSGAVLVEIKFTELNDIVAIPEITIEEMTEKDGDSYFTDSQQVNDAVIVAEDMVGYVVPTTTTEAIVPTTTVADDEPVVTTTAAAPVEDVTGSTDAPAPTDVPDTGANVAIFAALAVVAMAGVAVVVLRKKANA